MTSVTGARRRRLGLLGGTFDPPHIGHLVAAVSVGDALGLDEVWLVPNGDPWQKRDRPVTAAAVRLEMARAAAVGVPGVAVSDVEVRRPGPSFTIDTVHQLRAEDPDRDLVVIMGRDSAAGLPTWERHEELLAGVDLAVVDRAGVGARPELPGGRVTIVPMRHIEVSSTELRRLVAEGRPVVPLVAPAVAELIARHGLYRAATP
ncbi:MAG TPA: nicotinate-nucleotide adenylyltransferase [Iamia sp.]|nr:nicotinate-nucleotide adenylyltransferase [Iamia sp.]